ncbi:MAG TPA: hypothetical protein VH796_16515 [Nitrososphaeraceae archaeon]
MPRSVSIDTYCSEPTLNLEASIYAVIVLLTPSKESRYVRLAYTMYRVLRNSRTPLFLHRKSNHVFTMWQHLILLAIRQYEGKSYRMFTEWLVEAYYLDYF